MFSDFNSDFVFLVWFWQYYTNFIFARQHQKVYKPIRLPILS